MTEYILYIMEKCGYLIITESIWTVRTWPDFSFTWGPFFIWDIYIFSL